MTERKNKRNYSRSIIRKSKRSITRKSKRSITRKSKRSITRKSKRSITRKSKSSITRKSKRSITRKSKRSEKIRGGKPLPGKGLSQIQVFGDTWEKQKRREDFLRKVAGVDEAEQAEQVEKQKRKEDFLRKTKEAKKQNRRDDFLNDVVGEEEAKLVKRVEQAEQLAMKQRRGQFLEENVYIDEELIQEFIKQDTMRKKNMRIFYVVLLFYVVHILKTTHKISLDKNSLDEILVGLEKSLQLCQDLTEEMKLLKENSDSVNFIPHKLRESFNQIHEIKQNRINLIKITLKSLQHAVVTIKKINPRDRTPLNDYIHEEITLLEELLNTSTSKLTADEVDQVKILIGIAKKRVLGPQLSETNIFSI